MSEYLDFLASKTLRISSCGLDRVPELAPHLFAFQRHSVEFGLRVGRSGLFLDTGLGKTECQLEWCQRAIEATNGRALLLTPLAVAGQTKRRADKWGYEARVVRSQNDAVAGINICNYDRLDKLDPAAFQVISLDEASILKSFTGKTKRALIDCFRGARFKLTATATPAPNDHMELGNYAEFLEIMAANEMLSRFFINDTSTASHEWRLKGHAVRPFWEWLASWSRAGEKPSDLGDPENDERFTLPLFEVVKHRAKESRIDRELHDLFGAPSLSATEIFDLKRQTIAARAEKAAEIVQHERDRPWLIWCDTNYEADRLIDVIPGASEIRGSQSIERKEEILADFATGAIKHLIAKPSMCGHGLDWSHCARMIFVGRSFSYEDWYQAVRRCWRFGQTETVKVHLIVAEGETEISRIIDRKANDHADMKKAMRAAMRNALNADVKIKIPYFPTATARLPSWMCVV